jgi:hypothetical protein
MSRARLTAIAVVAAIVVAAGGLLVWRTFGVRHQPPMTVAQAGTVIDGTPPTRLRTCPGRLH